MMPLIVLLFINPSSSYIIANYVIIYEVIIDVSSHSWGRIRKELKRTLLLLLGTTLYLFKPTSYSVGVSFGRDFDGLSLNVGVNLWDSSRRNDVYTHDRINTTVGFPTLFLDVQSLRNLRKTEKFSEILRNLRKFEKSEKYLTKFPEINFLNYLK